MPKRTVLKNNYCSKGMNTINRLVILYVTTFPKCKFGPLYIKIYRGQSKINTAIYINIHSNI